MSFMHIDVLTGAPSFLSRRCEDAEEIAREREKESENARVGRGRGNGFASAVPLVRGKVRARLA